MLPVCTPQGRLRGLLTDRDIVTRCLAADRDPARARAETVMTRRIVAGSPAMDAAVAAHLMGREQVRRLPVLENGVLCGVVSLADLARRTSLALKVETDRPIFQQAQATCRLIIVSSIVAALASILMLLGLMEAWIVTPLKGLARSVQEVTRTPGFAGRLNVLRRWRGLTAASLAPPLPWP